MNSKLKFPRRVRILGGECDAIARALHHGEQESALMTHEYASSAPAGVKKFLTPTFSERK